jgi:hypothetical protein
MKNVILDLWADLRAKRLWPVAALLLVGLVAVPVALSKRSEAPPAPAPVENASQSNAAQAAKDALASVKLDKDMVGTGSSLDTFDPSNPFLPPAQIVKGAKQTSATAAQAGPSTSFGPTSGGSTGPAETGSTDGGTGGGGGQSGGGTGGGTGGGNETGGGKTTTTSYTYVIDATFTANGRTRTIHGMQKLDVLPSEADPLLIFMGVADDAGNAVFLVDATLQTAGEGTCKPSPSECAFLYLGPGSEQQFTTGDGDSYSLVVDQIRKVKVGAKSSAAKSHRKSKTARAAVGGPETPRRFVVPILADLVSVSSGADSHSNSDGDRR